MAGQGFLCRPLLINTCRFIFNNRLPQANQIVRLKQSSTQFLKDLKIPDKPKKPLTPYFRFIQERRPDLSKQHPEWKITQITVQCASEWNSLEPLKKQEYETNFKSEMEEYAKKYLKYTESLTLEQKKALEDHRKQKLQSKEKREKKKKIRENDKPKKPMGAYMFYVQEEHQQDPQKKYNKLLSDLKGKWADLPEGEKHKYRQRALKEKEIYEQNLKVWEMKMIELGNVDLVRQGTLAPKPDKTAKKK